MESGEHVDDTSVVLESLKESGTNDTALIKDASFLNMVQQINKNEDINTNQDDMT